MESVAYLDQAATTRVRPEVREAWLEATELYANPSGGHRLARQARRAIDDARDVLAAALGCEPGEIVFTGGGTESDNQAILGLVERHGGTAVCSAIEHHAVLHPVEHLDGRVVAATEAGTIDLDALRAALGPEVGVVSCMLVNNETGAVQPLAEVIELTRALAPNAAVHSDVVQALTWLDIPTVAAEADLLSISGHKFGGPKGVGALVVRSGTTVAPRLLGGGQERDLRSGTHNTAGIIAMARAAELTAKTRDETNEQVRALRDRLLAGLRSSVEGVHTTVPIDGVVAGACHLCIEGVESEALLFLLEQEDVYAAAASSCSSGALQMSHVLAAMGVPEPLARGSLRLSLGYDSTDADVDRCLAVLPAAVQQLRGA